MEDKKRHEMNQQAAEFLRACGFEVRERQSPNGEFLDCLEIGYGEIPDRTYHGMAKTVQPPNFTLHPAGA